MANLHGSAPAADPALATVPGVAWTPSVAVIIAAMLPAEAAALARLAFAAAILPLFEDRLAILPESFALDRFAPPSYLADPLDPGAFPLLLFNARRFR